MEFRKIDVLVERFSFFHTTGFIEQFRPTFNNQFRDS